MGLFDNKEYQHRGMRATGILDAKDFHRTLFYDLDGLFDWSMIFYVAAAAFF